MAKSMALGGGGRFAKLAKNSRLELMADGDHYSLYFDGNVGKTIQEFVAAAA